MKKFQWALPLFLIFSMWGQTQVDLATQSKNVDFSRALSTIPAKSGTVLPAACNPGEMFFKTDDPPGHNLYGCAPANTWTVLSSPLYVPLTTGPTGTVVVQGPLTFTGTGPNTVTSTGTLAPSDCASWDANGNIVDAGAPCNSILAPLSTTVGNLPQYANTTGTALSSGLGVVTSVGSPGSNSNIPTEKAVSTALGAAVAGALPAQIGVGSYLISNGTNASWGNIATGASGALDCVTLPGVCDVVTSVVPFKASANIWTGSNNFSASPFLKLVTGIGVPSSGCVVSTDPGKVYMRTDTMASNASMYVCSQTAAGVYSWEQPGTGSLQFSALTGGINTSASMVIGAGSSLSTSGSGTIAATSVPAAGVSGLAPSATIDTTNAANITSGTLPATQLPNPSATTLGGIESLSGVLHEWINSISTSGVPIASQPAFTDISGTVQAAQLPNPSATTLGGVESAPAVTHQWINSISSTGAPVLSQPAAGDISGLAASATIDTTNASNITSGTLPPAQLPSPTTTSLGGVQSAASVNHQWINSISPTGVPALSQPSAADISGLAASATIDTTNASNITSGTLAAALLPFISNNTALCNVSGSTAAPTACTASTVQSLLRNWDISSDPTVFQINTTDSALYGPFSFTALPFPGVNPDGRTNNVVSWGWNIGPNGAPLVLGQPAARMGIESHFEEGGVDPALEIHPASFYSTAGTEFRPLDFDFTYTNNQGHLNQSETSLASQKIAFSDDSRQNEFLVIDSNGAAAGMGATLSLDGKTVIDETTNNVLWLQQGNSEGTSAIPIAYVNASDYVVVDPQGHGTVVGGAATINGLLTVAGGVSGLAASATTDTTNASNITFGTLPSGRLPNPSLTSLGGVESIAAISHKWINSISNLGVPSLSQPTAADIAGLPTIASTANLLMGDSLGNAVASSLTASSVSAAVNASGTALQPPANGTSVLLQGSTGSPVTVAATVDTIASLLKCASTSGSGTAYACSTSQPFTPTTQDMILFRADVANTGSATLSVNSSTAGPIKKQGGSISLAANDLLAGQWVPLIYDGANWQTAGSVGNAAATVTSVGLSMPSTLCAISGTPITTNGTLTCTYATGQTANQVLGTSGTGAVGFSSSPGALSFISYGNTSTDSAMLGTELTSASDVTSTGWTGSYDLFTNSPGNTSPLSFAVGAVSGNKYQVVITISGASAGSVSAAIGSAAVTVNGNSAFSTNGTYTAGPQAAAAGSLVITPAATFNGSVAVSVRLISPISTFAFDAKDSTGADSFFTLQTLASLGNSFEGGGGTYNTTGSYNAAQGTRALFNNTTGSYNAAQGYQALYSNTTGTYNAAQGVQALYNNTTGINNAAQGYRALYSNTIGNNNVAGGEYALYSNTSGSGNFAQGYAALYSNTTGINNSAQGLQTLNYNTNGSYNLAQGFQALYSNTTGSYNTAQGAQAFDSNTTGSYNYCAGYNCGYRDNTNANYHSITDTEAVFLGAQASRDPVVPNATTLTNIACLGYDCKVAANNTVEIGNRVNSAVILNGIATAGGLKAPYLQAIGSAPSAIVSGTGCAVGTPTGTNIAGLIPVMGSGSACTVKIIWSASLAYANHSLCSPLQDRTSGALATQATDTTISATFAPIALTTGDTLQYGACTGY